MRWGEQRRWRRLGFDREEVTIWRHLVADPACAATLPSMPCHPAEPDDCQSAHDRTTLGAVVDASSTKGVKLAWQRFKLRSWVPATSELICCANSYGRMR
jgi:hypothetical protein